MWTGNPGGGSPGSGAPGGNQFYLNHERHFADVCVRLKEGSCQPLILRMPGCWIINPNPNRLAMESYVVEKYRPPLMGTVPLNESIRMQGQVPTNVVVASDEQMHKDKLINRLVVEQGRQVRVVPQLTLWATGPDLPINQNNRVGGTRILKTFWM